MSLKYESASEPLPISVKLFPATTRDHTHAVPTLPEREFFIDNLLVRNYFIIVMMRWTGLSPWEFEFPFPDSLTSAFLSSHSLGMQSRSSGRDYRKVTPQSSYRGTSLKRNCLPPRITIGA